MMHRPSETTTLRHSFTTVSRHVTFVRVTYMLPGGRPSIGSVHLYAARAACLEYLPLTTYFRAFEIENTSRTLTIGNIGVPAPQEGVAIGDIDL